MPEMLLRSLRDGTPSGPRPPIAPSGRFRRPLAALTLALTLVVTSALNAVPVGAQESSAQQLEQTLTWTADNDVTRYKTAPTTAVAGPTTLVFENSAATGNTSGMQHTLTFDTGDPRYNQDVNVNILADPFDANGGRWTVDVVLTPGTYRFFCAIPGHGSMTGLLVVTGGDEGEDTTAPTVSASLAGQQDNSGAYVGAATVTLTAEDAGSGVESVEYSLDGAPYTTYTAPLTVNEPGAHKVDYRATDVAGNTSAVRSVDFTVVAPPDPDTTAPTVTVAVSGERDADGAYVGAATVTLTASDADSGVARIEYSLDSQPFTTYTGPFAVNRPGQHSVSYRATDNAGNTSTAETVSFSVVMGGTDPDCPVLDTRTTVWFGTVNSGLPNRTVGTGCTINNLMASERNWLNHAEFMTHVRATTQHLMHLGVINRDERQLLVDSARESNVGKSDEQTGYRSLLSRSGASFKEWEHVGPGGFTRSSDGSITSKPVAGLGMLWYPVRSYGDFSLKLQWRDDAPGDGRANSGVFVRFPGVHQHPQESRPEWVAIKYGHEIQILDRTDGDQYKTGSVYGFDQVNLAGAGVTEKGTWNDYEIRVVGQHYSIFRNGVLINEYVNDPGAAFSPPRADDPGGAGRQNTHGYIGLQVHGANDIVSFRNVRVAPLTP
nr:family 16 glycoside hydrolase [Micromonospora yangpuensis]